METTIVYLKPLINIGFRAEGSAIVVGRDVLSGPALLVRACFLGICVDHRFTVGHDRG